MTEEAARPEITFRAWEGFVLWFVLWVVAGLVYSTISEGKCPSGTACDLRYVAGLVVLPAAFALGVLAWMRLLHRSGLGSLGLSRPTASAVWIGIGYGLAGRFLAFVTESATIEITRAVRGRPPKLPEQIDLPARPSALFWIGTAVAVIVLAPYAEELMFRGLLYLGVRARVGPAAAVIVSGLFFGVTHLQPLIIPALIVFGIVLARLREQRNDLTPAIVAHLTFNAIGFTALVAQHVV